MISNKLLSDLESEYATIVQAGILKIEHAISGQQGSSILSNGKKLVNMCSNNYLGLSADPAIVRAALKGLEEYGFGLSSVRFICGTQDIHKDLEQKIAEFFRCEDSILYGSCFDANGGLFEILLGEQDAIVSDSLNHASIIDGIRLCKAKRFRYSSGDLKELEVALQTAKEQGARRILLATDGVFSMDGVVADLPAICTLAEKYEAMVMVDDCHGSGFLGNSGRGSVEECGVEGRVDIITSTLGKALGGASGGFTTGKRQIIDLLRQRSRPYLFSNSLAPAIVTASIEALNIATTDSSYRIRLLENTKYYRSRMKELGFKIKGESHPIVPVMIGDSKLAYDIAREMFEVGVFVVGIAYPVVAQGQARIRTQVSAAHSKEELDFAVSTWEKVGRKFEVI